MRWSQAVLKIASDLLRISRRKGSRRDCHVGACAPPRNDKQEATSHDRMGRCEFFLSLRAQRSNLRASGNNHSLPPAQRLPRLGRGYKYHDRGSQ